MCRALEEGRLDHCGFLLIDRVSGAVLSPKDRQLWLYVRPLRDHIFVPKRAAHDIAIQCNRSPPSYCADATKGGSQPSRPPEQLPPAPEAVIIAEIRSAYHRAKAAGDKPPNVKEVSPPVQLVLEQKGYRASRRQIEKLAETDEFKLLRWPAGKRRSKPQTK